MDTTARTQGNPPQCRTARAARGWCRALPFSIYLASLLVTLLGVVPPATAQGESGRVLKDISFFALPGDRVELRLELSGPPPKPHTFTTDNPARLALDLPDTQLGVSHRNLTVGVGAVHSLTALQADGRTRVVVNLVQSVPYTTRIEGNSLLVTVGGTTTSRVAVAAPLTPTVNGPAVLNVDFRRGADGEGRIIVTLSDKSIRVDMRQVGDDIVVDFFNAGLPERLARRLDVLDFATPVKTVDTYAKDGNVHMVIATSGEYEHLAYQSNDVFTIEVKPVTKEQQEAAKKKKFGYTGEKLSLNFQDIDVRAVLQLLADFTGLNIVTSDTVQGSLTLRLKNVPWDQALDIILKTKGLAMRKTGNVILVAPIKEITAREEEELKSQKQVADLAPLRSEYIQVNYAKATDIAALLKAEKNSLLTKDRGNVAVDERTNTLLIQDTGQKLAEIRQLVARLDVPVRQVLIESRIVIANENFAKDLGVRFGVTGIRKNGNDGIGVSAGRISGTDDVINQAASNLQSTGQAFPIVPPLLGDRLNVDLGASPAAGTPGSIAFALLGSKYLIDLELSALQAEGRGEVISNPRVITANQSKAIIEQGEEIPYQSSTGQGTNLTPRTEFKKAVLSLEVTPQITPDDRLILTLRVSQDSRGADTPAGPAINTQRVETQVLVDNGETVVLGGIYQQTTNHAVRRVPFLGDIPLLGALFRDRSEVNDKRELLVFVTPKIIKQSLALN